MLLRQLLDRLRDVFQRPEARCRHLAHLVHVISRPGGIDRKPSASCACIGSKPFVHAHALWRWIEHDPDVLGDCRSLVADDEEHESLLIASGADVKTVQARPRHASAKTTLDVYGHVWPDRDESTGTAVDAALAARESLGNARASL